MSSRVQVDARGLFEKFRRLDLSLQEGVKAVVRKTADGVRDDVVQMLDRPVSKSGKAGRTVRSRPGQAPRTETGALKKSVRVKTSPKGWVGTVTADAADAKGNRYPWMLESGTDKMKKRPFMKKAQRKAKKPFQRAVAKAISDAVAKAGR